VWRGWRGKGAKEEESEWAGLCRSCFLIGRRGGMSLVPDSSLAFAPKHSKTADKQGQGDRRMLISGVFGVALALGLCLGFDNLTNGHLAASVPLKSILALARRLTFFVVIA